MIRLKICSFLFLLFFRFFQILQTSLHFILKSLLFCLLLLPLILKSSVRVHDRHRSSDIGEHSLF